MLRMIVAGMLLTLPCVSVSHAKELLEIEITSGIRSEVGESRQPVKIDVIGRQEIEGSGALHIVDVLRGRGAIQLTDTFGDGSRVNVSMRGFADTANANTLILVDGRRLNNTDIASPDLNSISLKDVERIEVIQGSSSVLYGDQAVGGVINVITKLGYHAENYVGVNAGSYSHNSSVVHVDEQFGHGFSVRFSGEIRDSEGYREHNELKYSNYFAGLEQQFATGKWFVELQSTDEDLHTPGALFLGEAGVDRRQSRTEYLNDYIETRTGVFRAGLKLELGSNWKFEGEWTYRDSDGEFLQSFRNFASTTLTEQDRRVQSFNPRLIGNHDIGGRDITTTLGFDYEESRYRFSNKSGWQRGDQQTSGLYGQVIYPVLDNLDISGGLRFSRVMNQLQDGGAFGSTFAVPTDINDSLSAREIGLIYRPNRLWKLYWRIAENFRFAKLDEYIDGVNKATIINNQDGKSFEVGFDYRKDAWDISMQAYELELDDEIAYDPTAFDNINLDRTRRKGLLAGIGYRLSPSTSTGLDVNLISAKVLAGKFAGNRVPMVAKYSARIWARHRFDRHWSMAAEWYGIGDRVYSGDFNQQLDQLNGYRVVNMNATYERNGWIVDFRMNNLLNEKYADFGARSGTNESIQPSPERNVSFNVRYRF